MHHKLIVSLIVMLVLINSCAQPDKPLSDIEGLRQQMTDIERGRYVVEIMGCNDCHTPGYLVKRSNLPAEDWLVGSTLGFRGYFGTAYPTNLRLAVQNMSEEDWLILAKKMREGSAMADVMLPETADQDLRAIYRFIKYLGPKGTPSPLSLPEGVKPTTQYIDVPVRPH
jgi:hypothetical protein